MSQHSGGQSDAPFRQVAAVLRERVGTLRPGDRLPSVRALVAEFGVASATASRAVALLVSEGIVESVPRIGTVVARPGPRRRARARDERPGFDALVDLAVELADTDGLSAVSMRRLGTESGIPTSAVQELLHGRGDLVLAMLERVFAVELPPVDAREATWRERLTAAAAAQWSVYTRHPWAARAISLHRPQPVPSLLALAEWNLTALEEVSGDRERRFDLHLVLVGYVRGMAITMAAEQEARIDTGVDAEIWADRDPATVRGMQRLAGPALRRAGPYVYDLDRAFHAGLAALLDGIV